MAQTVDFIIDGGILLNIGVGRGDIRLRLIVIVVGYEIFYRILGKKFAQLGAELCGQRQQLGHIFGVMGGGAAALQQGAADQRQRLFDPQAVELIGDIFQRPASAQHLDGV